jgi:ElaB/YqjD/DUF883 family membrane-anchored ribosome-binding protein
MKPGADMENEQNEQGEHAMHGGQSGQSEGVSDHAKFGESSSSEGSPLDAPHVFDKAEESAASLRERAVQLKTQLADRLETNAERLRRRANDTAALDDAIATTKERVADASDRVASGMEKSADWLRNANMSNLQRGLERQVKENPGRTLLIAAGIGYLLGRAFKGKGA